MVTESQDPRDGGLFRQQGGDLRDGRVMGVETLAGSTGILNGNKIWHCRTRGLDRLDYQVIGAATHRAHQRRGVIIAATGTITSWPPAHENSR
ncbi:hypothetical protein AOC05_18155 [Arthrobacter alpinus]|uniref:Uncharacterized protein n=1 Tax=Arthrobacter alpinus TaxID=656366 RepID=A0A0M3UH36_9MICC|nr:hypothetical protein [Arthrobacter alpinus]ALE93799.1 hypothetical protein AOC05_18155 [Arthrobacter alpinus]